MRCKTVVRFQCQLIKNSLADATARPTIEAVVDSSGMAHNVRANRAKASPTHVEYPIQIVRSYTAQYFGSSGIDGFKKRPFFIAQIEVNDVVDPFLEFNDSVLADPSIRCRLALCQLT